MYVSEIGWFLSCFTGVGWRIFSNYLPSLLLCTLYVAFRLCSWCIFRWEIRPCGTDSVFIENSQSSPHHRRHPPSRTVAFLPITLVCTAVLQYSYSSASYRKSVPLAVSIGIPPDSEFLWRDSTWVLCLCKFSIGILTENFMNSGPSGILYCLTWVHQLRTCRNGRGRSTGWLTRSGKLTVRATRDSRVANEVRYYS